jgi:hypothetical protein
MTNWYLTEQVLDSCVTSSERGMYFKGNHLPELDGSPAEFVTAAWAL